MKPIRFLKTVWAFSSLGVLAGISSQLCLAAGVVNLKQIQVSDGPQIDIMFDGKVQKDQIKAEFFNDIIQLSITDVAVYPAKISSVNGGNLLKIFAYQYAPKLVRCRFTVKGRAENYKDRFDIKAGGKVLTILVEGQHLAKAERDPGEQALLERVLAADPGAPSAAPAQGTGATKTVEAQQKPKDSITVSSAAPTIAQPGNAEKSVEKVEPAGAAKATSSEEKSLGKPKLTGGKPLPSPFKAMGKMMLVLALFGFVAFGVTRLAKNRSEARIAGGMRASDLAVLDAEADAQVSSRGFFASLLKFARKASSGLSRSSKMIEVLSTHYLGPKKSIAVVRVAGRVLVLGVSNDSINLITQLSGDGMDAAPTAEGFDLRALGITAQPQAQAQQQPKPPTQSQAPVQKSRFSEMLGVATAKQDPFVQPQKPTSATFAGPRAYAAAAAQAPSGAQVFPGASSNSPSSVRAQIRSRLEGLKPL